MRGYMAGQNYRTSIFLAYCSKMIDGVVAPVVHYRGGYIDKYFMTWLVWKGWLSHADNPAEAEYRTHLGQMKSTYSIPM
jgi:hypothetical protein